MFGGEGGVEDVEVGFVVEAEGAGIEVGGADGDPAVVEDGLFDVEHGGLEFVDADAGFEERAPFGAGGLSDGHDVDLRAGEEDIDGDAAAAGVKEGVGGEIIGDEAGEGEADVVFGGDGEEIEELHGVGAALRAGLEDLAGGFAGGGEEREVVRAVEDMAGSFDPIVVEGAWS